jgi:hypothetical protein
LYSVADPCVASSSYSAVCNKSGSTGGGSYKYECCSTDNCNNQAYYKGNIPKILTNKIPTYLTTYSTKYIPTYSSVTISVSLRVNLAFVVDYTNLNSATSLTFIQNLKTFVIIYYLLFYF